MMDQGRMMRGPMGQNWWGQGRDQSGGAGSGMIRPGMMVPE